MAAGSYSTLDELIAADQGATPDQPEPAPQAQPAGATVKFVTQGVQPPSSIYITRGDKLRVIIWNSATGMEVDLGARLLRADGSVIVVPFQLFPTNNRASNTFDLDLAEGFLLGVCATTPTGSVKRGQCWVSILLIRGTGANATVHQSLVLDYVETGAAVQWPGGLVDDPVSGNGNLRMILGTTPPVASAGIETVPTGARWKLLAFTQSITTDATAGTRRIRLSLFDTVGTYAYCGGQFTAAPSSTVTFIWLSGVVQGQVDTGFFSAALPTDALLRSAGQVITSIIGVGAGDQLTAPVYSVIEWVEPQ